MDVFLHAEGFEHFWFGNFCAFTPAAIVTFVPEHKKAIALGIR
jgi:hypothetical protein